MKQIERAPAAWPRAGASIAVFKDDHVLLVKRAKPPKVWSLPGGHVEPGETAAAAAMRELSEETGITARLIGLNDVMDAIFHDERSGTLRAHYMIASYIGLWTGGSLQAGDDAEDAAWVHPDMLDRYALTPRASELITGAITKLRDVKK